MLKGWTLDSRLLDSLREAAVQSKFAAVSAFLQACMVGKSPLVYVFFNTNEVKFLSEAAWLCGMQASLLHMDAALVSMESEWDFSFGRIDSCVTVGCFAAGEARVKHRGYSALEGFADACNFQISFEKLGHLPLFPDKR